MSPSLNDVAPGRRDWQRVGVAGLGQARRRSARRGGGEGEGVQLAAHPPAERLEHHLVLGDPGLPAKAGETTWAA